ncbi:hypothetical protein C4D60_Mb07t18600 [Musa balbisiana]|uniref:Uncharacterized protein n=1 Tax=Musa balbisiana TaxID=52838 RepID=A0A4S8JG90_MUSBA|nr:hypothetical protein C4D60_Mb07t18600 [Musa balbisiana]
MRKLRHEDFDLYERTRVGWMVGFTTTDNSLDGSFFGVFRLLTDGKAFQISIGLMVRFEISASTIAALFLWLGNSVPRFQRHSPHLVQGST